MKLKPCPFCGGKAGIIVRPCIGYSKRSRGSVQYIAQCDSKVCIGRTTKRYRSEEEAIEAWNRRVGEGEKE